MSILIKGMDKETAVRICAYAGVRMDDSDFVPVPPHGRLIDADAFLDDLLFPSKQFEQGMRELVADAPTIVPAEEAPPEDTNAPGTYDILNEEGEI